MCSFTPAPVYKPSRKYMSSEHHLFLIRLNVETGSSNQPWAFLPTLLFLHCPTNRNKEMQVLLLFLHRPCRNSKGEVGGALLLASRASEKVKIVSQTVR